MDSTYDHRSVESYWRAKWRDAGLFRTSTERGRRKFTVALPLPSVTAKVHIGHALQGTVQDILIRYRRMSGDDVLWIPGIDQAAIGTQLALERRLAEGGETKEGIGRQRFQREAERWYAEYTSVILDQLQELGMALDLGRTRFTGDESYRRAVRVAFVRLWDQGLIHRDFRIGNRCFSCRTDLADIEVTWRPAESVRCALRCTVRGRPGRTLTVSGVRPGLLGAWTGVAVPPDDASLADLVGGEVVVPLHNVRVPVVADGTIGEPTAVTPAHDAAHLLLARRHGLAVHRVPSEEWTVPAPPPDREDRPQAGVRTPVLAALAAAGFLAGTSTVAGRTGACGRCGGPVEEVASRQWFLRTAGMAERAESEQSYGLPHWHPDRFEKAHRDWLRERRDWCISRQLWLGHRIPVYTCAAEHVFASVEAPVDCPDCGSTRLRQDPDVLDTWFASTLWPFVAVGWPDRPGGLTDRCPTDLTVTNRDIIGLALSRTVLMGVALTGRVPFAAVVITCNVLAPDGRKMLASRGNGVDPRAVAAEVSADALRGWAADAATRGQDIRFDAGRVEGYRRFARRLWRITAEVLAPAEAAASSPLPVPTLMDRWIISRLGRLIEESTGGIDEHRFHVTMAALERFVNHDLCEWYFRAARSRLAAGEARCVATSLNVLSEVLRLLHPMMPFVTEELWHRLPGERDFLLNSGWPDPTVHPADAEAEARIGAVIRAVREIREIRARRPAVTAAGDRLVAGPTASREAVELAARLADLSPGEGPAGAVVPLAALDACLILPPTDSMEAVADGVRRRLRRERGRLRAQLDDQDFLMKADPQVVAGRRTRLAEVEEQWTGLARRPGGSGSGRQ
jgi:valyl-tRNA synthetase